MDSKEFKNLLGIPVKVTKVKDDFIWLDGEKYPINKIPSGISIDGDLNLRYTRITELPDDLMVGGYLDLRYTPIKELPDDLMVGGSLDLEDTPIKELPEGLKVGGKIYKDF